jgi:flagellar hook assembly protein FlgD
VKLPKPQFTGIDDPGISVQKNGRFSNVYPNPSSGEFTIQFTLNTPLHIRITVSDMFGRPVAGLFDGQVSDGTHTVTWNGQNYNGHKVPSGMYLYKFEAGTHSETGKLIVQ